jgi:hypothetical protein
MMRLFNQELPEPAASGFALAGGASPTLWNDARGRTNPFGVELDGLSGTSPPTGPSRPKKLDAYVRIDPVMANFAGGGMTCSSSSSPPPRSASSAP